MAMQGGRWSRAGHFWTIAHEDRFIEIPFEDRFES
jgi:hypothetical protein